VCGVEPLRCQVLLSKLGPHVQGVVAGDLQGHAPWAANWWLTVVRCGLAYSSPRGGQAVEAHASRVVKGVDLCAG